MQDLVDALAQLSFAVQGALLRTASARDLSLVQTRLLGVLRDREPTMAELARLLGLDKSSTTGLVDRAARRGLVQRTVTPEDRRAFRVSLTDVGRALVAEAEVEFREAVGELLAVLPPADRATLNVLVDAVLAGRGS